jgi:chemotaxis protein CheZ
MRDATAKAKVIEFPLKTLTERMRQNHECDIEADPIILEDVVMAVLGTMDERLTPVEATLLREIAGLGRIIDQAKADIAGVSVDAITVSYIPSATDQLDAIVEHTAAATNSILECCELLERVAITLDTKEAGIVGQAVTQIYEACGFQDITGQRITKVINALQAIESRVLALGGGGSTHGGVGIESAAPDPRSVEELLLNGPALSHEAMAQHDIDKLMADFD